jgi:hypothetical protein
MWVNGRIILNWSQRNRVGGCELDSSASGQWLLGRLFLPRQITFGFHRGREMSWFRVQLTFKRGLSPMDFSLLLLLRCGTTAADGLIVHFLLDTWINMGQRWNYTDRGNRSTRRKVSPSATLSTTTFTWISNAGREPGPPRLHAGDKLLAIWHGLIQLVSVSHRVP